MDCELRVEIQVLEPKMADGTTNIDQPSINYIQRI